MGIIHKEKFGVTLSYDPRIHGEMDELSMSLYAFKHATDPDNKYLALLDIIEDLWIRDRVKPVVQVHPYLERMLRTFCEHTYVAVGGGAGVGKSFALAIWGLVSWMCSFNDTVVLLTSTSLVAARRRSWGDLENLWQEAQSRIRFPGKLVSALGYLRTVDPRTGKGKGKHGVYLIASNTSKDSKGASNKMIGFHANRVIVLGDELSELPKSVVDATMSNLSQGCSFFQFISASNPNSRHDSFGIMSEPSDEIGGWEGLGDDKNHSEWPTRVGGMYLRLSQLDSPNLGLGPNEKNRVITYLPVQDDIDKIARVYGEDSAQYNRMVLAIFATQGERNLVLSELDLIKASVFREPTWKNPPTPIAGFDPAFTNGGDRSILATGLVGLNADGKPHLHVTGVHLIADNSRNKKDTRSEQIVDALMAVCREHNVPPPHLAVDSTGAGSTLADLIRMKFGREIHPVNFGGAASDAPASATDKKPAKERYQNRASELAFNFRELVVDRQVTIFREGARLGELKEELTSRSYKNTKNTGNLRVMVQSKEEYRKELGRSPDMMDAISIMIDLAKTRHRLVPTTAMNGTLRVHEKWRKIVMRRDIVTKSDRFLVREKVA